MSSNNTVQLFDSEDCFQQPPSFDFYETSDKGSWKDYNVIQFGQAVGVALLLAVSSFTAISDPWLLEKYNRDVAPTISIYKDVIGRPISRTEALRISREIMENAEQERLAAAEFEAERGIQLENES